MARGAWAAAVLLCLAAGCAFVPPQGSATPPQAPLRTGAGLSQLNAADLEASDAAEGFQEWSPAALLAAAAALGLLLGVAAGPQPAAADYTPTAVNPNGARGINPGSVAKDLKKNGQAYLKSETQLYDPNQGGASNFTDLEVGRWSQPDFLRQEARYFQSKAGAQLNEQGKPVAPCQQEDKTCAVMAGNRYGPTGDLLPPAVKE